MKSNFVPIQSLNEAERMDLFSLLHTHYDGVDVETFDSDLKAKTHVLRLFGKDERLAGFSTIDYRCATVGGRAAAILYSGDTIVDPSEWAAASLGAAWVAGVLELHAEHESTMPLWWLLLTSGVRTYRYLTACVRRYAPALPNRLDSEAMRLLPELAAARFGERYDASTGIVRLEKPQQLRGRLADVPAHLAADPDMSVFLRGNPNFAAGDEFVSLSNLSEANLTPVGLLSLRRGRRSALVNS